MNLLQLSPRSFGDYLEQKKWVLERWHQAWKPPAFHNSETGNGRIERGTQKYRPRKA
jgi:hypothetical protein